MTNDEIPKEAPSSKLSLVESRALVLEISSFFGCLGSWVFGCFPLVIILASTLNCTATSSVQELFTGGSQAYATGKYEAAAASFIEAAEAAPAPGTLHNLGNAEWQLGHTGPAVLAWERAQWLDPFSPNPRANLRYARKARLLEAPDLGWFEICSTWLPANAWPWIASFSLWLAIALVIFPGVFRWRKASWQQALAAAGFAIFLLTIPALIGIQSRTKLGVILPRNVNLCLTPTSEAQPIARLAAGEIVRLERERGKYLFVRTSTASGWIARSQFSLIAR